ncbi:MAG: hypothetical protein Q4F11_06310 [Eubacteriales bacterium]|nr:hypothetical protein [Eubacteriales bacterium]
MTDRYNKDMKEIIENSMKMQEYKIEKNAKSEYTDRAKKNVSDITEGAVKLSFKNKKYILAVMAAVFLTVVISGVILVWNHNNTDSQVVETESDETLAAAPRHTGNIDVYPVTAQDDRVRLEQFIWQTIENSNTRLSSIQDKLSLSYSFFWLGDFPIYVVKSILPDGSEHIRAITFFSVGKEILSIGIPTRNNESYFEDNYKYMKGIYIDDNTMYITAMEGEEKYIYVIKAEETKVTYAIYYGVNRVPVHGSEIEWITE